MFSLSLLIPHSLSILLKATSTFASKFQLPEVWSSNFKVVDLHLVYKSKRRRMEVVPVAAFVNVLVQNLVELSKREFPQIRGLKKEVQKLNLNLLTIQQFLNGAETQTISNEAVKIWLKRLENAAFEADDVLDELHYHAAFPKELKTNIKKKEKKLEIDVSMEGSRETSVATVDRILKGCSCYSLCWLSLTGMEGWECMLEPIQHLTSVSQLELKNFGMEEIAEWFDQFISHRDSQFNLKLFECKRRSPSTDAMRRLIEDFRVIDFQELTTTQSDDSS